MIVSRKVGQDSQNPEKDEFYFGRRGLGHFIASEIKANYTDIAIEIWRIDKNVNEKKSRNIKNNLISIVYPMKGSNRFHFSYSFLRELRKESKEHDLIIWFDGLHQYFFLIISFYLRKIFQIAHNLGGDNYPYKYKKTKKLKYRLAEILEAKLFIQNINLGLLGSKMELDYFLKYQNKGNSILTYVVGLNEKRWRLIDKHTARKKIGIPMDEKVILQAGRLSKNKGAHLTLEAWIKYLKDKGVKLYYTGVNKEDESYKIVKESGAQCFGIIDHESFPYWMAAADVYVYPPFDDVTLNFAGIGYAPLEALATGTPIVCTTAQFLKFYGIDKEQYGDFIKIPTTIEEIGTMTLDLMNNQPAPQECNAFVKNHFSNDKLLEKVILRIEKLKPGFFWK